MNQLLDTHTLLWYLDGDLQLSETCRARIDDVSNTNFVSIASFWEIAIKLSIGGKVDLSVPFDELERLVWQNNINLLPIEVAHTVLVRSLPYHHKDPFDRIMIAQAMAENIPILSRDSYFKLYDIQTIW